MRANKGKNGIYFDQISSFELECIENFRGNTLKFLDYQLKLEYENLNKKLELYIYPDYKIMELKKIKRQLFESSYFCEITYRQKIFYLDANLNLKITENENDFLHFLYRTDFFRDDDSEETDYLEIVFNTSEMILIDRLITLNMQPTPIKTLLIDEIYNERGQKCFYYLSQNFPDSEKFTGIIKYSIIYRLLDKNKYTKKTTSQDKYFELIRLQYHNELNGKKFSRMDSLITDKALRLINQTEKLLNDFDNDL